MDQPVTDPVVSVILPQQTEYIIAHSSKYMVYQLTDGPMAPDVAEAIRVFAHAIRGGDDAKRAPSDVDLESQILAKLMGDSTGLELLRPLISAQLESKTGVAVFDQIVRASANSRADTPPSTNIPHDLSRQESEQ
eukprot:Blabericola_migrator_1__4892@NODE_2557_length_2614_cov_305_202199_g1537_i1_p3_GENE_NODE_2557_length_2614_cov_305_202199_g1537_i1NODE_2557_length_2614_cov_305_202199_g1537_i1_p3_ORF_typecomplete_len135_score16_13_NODE_2557_length_2614_cov_305_202199_g1537_i119772381